MNRLFKNRTLNNWLGFLFALSILIATIATSNHFVSKLKQEEQSKIEIIANAQEVFANNNDVNNPKVQDLLLKILQSNTSIPVMVVDKLGNVVESVNVSEKVLGNPNKTAALLAEMKSEHQPIVIQLAVDDQSIGKQYIYYKNSYLLTQLQYYPIILVLLIAIFIWFTFWYFRTLKNTQQSFLWAGMAKETAHQIGTPLSSLMGWIELFKLEAIDHEPLQQMENDVQRLKQIAERFSKIGSLPELEPVNMVQLTKDSFDYLQARISKNIVFHFNTNQAIIIAPLNPSLYSWVIENLVKNAADAMNNKGQLTIQINAKKNWVEILVKDTGPGISKRLQKRIFEPGYTTKKRGWGLGLSLAKRIIKNYHKGKIEVAKSDKNGTTFRILLKTSK